MRLDQFLVEKNFTTSRHRAHLLIHLGQVSVDEKTVFLKSFQVKPHMNVSCNSDIAYVSRGGLKLEQALLDFEVMVKDKNCLDVGLSTGGFSDCLLKQEASSVVGVDVGQSQIHETLQEEKRLQVFEKQDIRNFKTLEKFDLIVMDVSFISSGLIYSHLTSFFKNKGELLSLFKPQFEMGKSYLNKKGIVKEKYKSDVEEKIQDHLKDLKSLGFYDLKFQSCLLKGAQGNQEFFIYAKWSQLLKD